MYKIVSLLLVLTLLAINSSFANEDKYSILNIDATVNKEIMPDAVKIRFYVENSGINLTDLKEKNDKTVNDAMQAIKANLNEKETIKTIAFRVNKIYSHKDKIQIFQKYIVTNGFEVKLKDLNKISKIINLAMNNGVKDVENIQFFVENTEDVCNSMMAEAISIAKNRAYYLANHAQITIEKVKNISPYCSLSNGHVSPKVYNSFARANGAQVETDSVELDTIEPGAINARANVNMSFYLK